MIDIDVLTESYLIMKEYVPAKDRQTAADHLISSLVDMSIDERELRKFAGTDSYLERAIEEYFEDQDKDEVDEDDDDYNYDDD